MRLNAVVVVALGVAGPQCDLVRQECYIAAMPLRIRTTNYKALRHIDFTPEGVCAITGPNGSGKSTLLYAVEVLRLAMEEDLGRALRWAGDSSNLKSYGSSPAEACRIELSTDRRDGTVDGAERPITWTIDMDPLQLAKPREMIRVAGAVLTERSPDQVFVMTPNAEGVQPQALTDLKSSEQLGLFELGDWYGRNGFGSRRRWCRVEGPGLVAGDGGTAASAVPPCVV